MKCKECKAFGATVFGYRGCLIGRKQLEFKSGKGCRAAADLIDKKVAELQANDTTLNQYWWLNQETCEHCKHYECLALWNGLDDIQVREVCHMFNDQAVKGEQECCFKFEKVGN